ncbi:MAG: CARDB domain-containing protein [Nanoarchaeota archaeon]
MKRNVLILIIGAFLLIAGVFVFAQGVIPPGLISVFGPVPLLSCSESDGGANIYVQGFNSVTYLGPTGTVLNASAWDYCLNGLLVEGVCSSWINANFNLSLNMSGYAAIFNCSASNTGNTTYICLQGACLPQNSSGGGGGGGNNTNSTNLTLPNLIVVNISRLSYNSTNVTINGTNVTAYTVNVTTRVRNIGNALAGASVTRVIIPGWPTQQLVTSAIPMGVTVPVSSYYTSVPGGTVWTVTSTADSLNQVTESNENDNSLTVTLTIP